MYVADTKRLTHDGAKRMMTTAIAAAQEAGIAIAVAITDAGGHLILLERMDGGRFATVHSATTKAVCAASNKRPTSPNGAQAQPLDVAHALGLALAAGVERWTAMEGGFPVIADGECIGGIGVAGGDWETDERIARAAIEAIGASWGLDKRGRLPTKRDKPVSIVLPKRAPSNLHRSSGGMPLMRREWAAISFRLYER